MRVDKGSKRIMNLDLILDFGEIWYIKCMLDKYICSGKLTDLFHSQLITCAM